MTIAEQLIRVRANGFDRWDIWTMCAIQAEVETGHEGGLMWIFQDNSAIEWHPDCVCTHKHKDFDNHTHEEWGNEDSYEDWIGD